MCADGGADVYAVMYPIPFEVTMDGSPGTPMLFAWAPWYLAYGVYYLAFCIPALFVLRGRVLDDTTRAV